MKHRMCSCTGLGGLSDTIMNNEWSENQADKYYATLKFACKEIGENPELGKDYTGIKRNLLGLKSGRHIIFYHLISEDEIEVIRILHERMDLKNRLTE